MKTQTEKTSPQEVNPVAQILGNADYSVMLSKAQGTTFFGQPLEALSKEQLMVAVAFQASTIAKTQEMEANMFKLLKEIRMYHRVDREAAGGSILAKTNPFKPGDWVELKHDVRDAYREKWHEAGDVMEVAYIAEDGEGLMFSSNLGIHFTQVRPAKKPENANT